MRHTVTSGIIRIVDRAVTWITHRRNTPPGRLKHLDSRRALAREVPRELAGAVGSIAACRLASGVRLEPAAIDANYVRRSDAELFWREW